MPYRKNFTKAIHILKNLKGSSIQNFGKEIELSSEWEYLHKMPSVVPGFEYDIFISYRHNDNRSGWVTDFVNALQEELAATIKEPLSIYFDKNPHDGLLETYNVDKSLEGKLRCLIFIPIISQTYCDPKSFAWQHEFCAFNSMCNEDAPLSSGEGPGVRSIGRDIKLSNGNVASRILPIKIHDLDAEDNALLESELGGALRAIEFIYKEPGVNRPLKIGDERNSNLNKTDYRNQINKVANAVKELVNAIHRPEAALLNKVELKVRHKSRSKYILKVLIVCMVMASAAGIYWFLNEGKSTSKHDKILDRAEKLLEERVRFEDKRYAEQAFQAIQSVLAEDSLNERGLYLFITLAEDADTAQYFIKRLIRINPNGKYAQITRAGQMIQKSNWPGAKDLLMQVLEKEPNNKDALGMIAFLSLTTHDYLNCYRYAKQLEVLEAKIAHQILSTLYMELGDFKESFRQLKQKQSMLEFSCEDVEGFQRILLCEGDFEKLERLTDSLCNFSKCPDCDFWQLRAKVHTGKFKEAARWVGPSLKQMPKITWRYPAFVLLKNGKKDSAKIIAQAEVEFDKLRLADTAYHQSIPLYSIAAIHAMFGNSKESLTWLKQYASKGFEMGSEWYIAHDPLFDEMQKDNEYFTDFMQLFQKEQAKKMAIREELRKLETNSPR
jgi:cytochrome c-type biogenesis protein CcmH/NrfG